MLPLSLSSSSLSPPDLWDASSSPEGHFGASNEYKRTESVGSELVRFLSRTSRLEEMSDRRREKWVNKDQQEEREEEFT